MHRRFMRRVALFAALALVAPVLGAPLAAPALAQGKAKGKAQEKAQEKAQDRVQLDSVTIHLFLATSGTWSPDIETIEGFGAHNFALQGKGIADNERFHAGMIKVRFTSQGRVFAQGTQATVVVTDRWRKRVVRRERIVGVLIGSAGYTHVPIFLPDAACGPFEVVVTGGGRKIVKQIETHCGE
jgi:hypothetical protein